MKSIQYTIRNVPPEVDRTLRAKARKTGKSFNQVVVEEISARTATQKPSDFAAFYKACEKLGPENWKAFDESMKWMDSLPNEIFDE